MINFGMKIESGLKTVPADFRKGVFEVEYGRLV